MWIICQAVDSLEISRLIFSEKKKKLEYRLLQILFDTLKLKYYLWWFTLISSRTMPEVLYVDSKVTSNFVYLHFVYCFNSHFVCSISESKSNFIYVRCSKWIAYFYLETSNFKLAQKYSFHALEVLPVARNAKFQPMYPLLEGVTVRWFGHSNKVLMNGRSKCLSGLVFPPSKECFQFRKQKQITWGKVWGIRGVRQNSYFFFLQKRRNYCGGMSWGIVM